VALALVIGILGVGGIIDSYAVLSREIAANYLRTNPASASLFVKNLSPELVKEIEALPYIRSAEARQKIVARAEVEPGEWKTIWLFVIRDFNNIRINKIFPQQGNFYPKPGEIVIERNALKIIPTAVGGKLNLKLPHTAEKELQVTGIIHDPGQAPSWMEGLGYGYITPKTLELLGYTPQSSMLHIVAARGRTDREQVNKTAQKLCQWLEQKGINVNRVIVPKPLTHPHAGQMNSFMAILGLVGLLALCLGSVLAVSMISAIMSRQIQQIAIMKTLGATTWQVARIYFLLVAMISAIALLFSFPLSLVGGKIYSASMADKLNFNILDPSIPLWAYVFKVLIALFLPMIIAAFPILKGCGITIKKGITGTGSLTNGFKGAFLLKLSETLFFRQTFEMMPSKERHQSDREWGAGATRSRPVVLALRSTFRKPGRLVWTLLTLVCGGVLFMVAMTINSSISRTIDQAFAASSYDLFFKFSGFYPAERIRDSLEEVKGIDRVELVTEEQVTLPGKNKEQESSFRIIAIPISSDFKKPEVISGHWLDRSASGMVVVNTRFAAVFTLPMKKKKLELPLPGGKANWEISGTVKEAFGAAAVYVDLETYNRFSRKAGKNNTILVRTISKDNKKISAIRKELEKSFALNRLDVYGANQTAEIKTAVDNHLQMMVMFLVTMSLFTVFVGGIGLMAAMGINVLEQTREIGIMRTIGASNPDLFKIILFEGGLTGMISWTAALFLTLPLSRVIGNVFSNIMLGINLDFSFSWTGMILWLFIIILFSLLASYLPARRASRLVINKALAYI
jgi:putative ABC transport system permease protein